MPVLVEMAPTTVSDPTVTWQVFDVGTTTPSAYASISPNPSSGNDSVTFTANNVDRARNVEIKATCSGVSNNPACTVRIDPIDVIATNLYVSGPSQVSAGSNAIEYEVVYSPPNASTVASITWAFDAGDNLGCTLSGAVGKTVKLNTASRTGDIKFKATLHKVDGSTISTPSFTVTVISNSVTSVTLSGPTSVRSLEDIVLIATYSPPSVNPVFSWLLNGGTVNNNTYIQISPTGTSQSVATITGKSPGGPSNVQAVSTANGILSGALGITVTYAFVTGITINGRTAINDTETEAFTATVLPAAPQTNQAVTWSVHDSLSVAQSAFASTSTLCTITSSGLLSFSRYIENPTVVYVKAVTSDIKRDGTRASDIVTISVTPGYVGVNTITISGSTNELEI
jgi:hypothetical protein